MMQLVKNLPILVAASVLTLSSCKKITIPESKAVTGENTGLTNGLGETTTVNGYLYASKTNYQGGSTYHSFFAAFSDPAKKLPNGYNHFTDNVNNFSNAERGNIDVGNVKFGNSMFVTKNLFSNTCFYFQSTSFGTFNPHWSTDGNKSFTAMDINVVRGYPSVGQVTTQTIYKNSDNVISLSGFGNYDSLVVVITDGGSPQFAKRKAFASTVSSVTFGAADLSNIFASSGYIYFYTYNYSHQTINGKRCIFELSNKYIHYIGFQP